MFASLPHFLNADPQLVNAVDGVSPDPNLHEFLSKLLAFRINYG